MTLDMLLKYIVNHKNTLLCTCSLYKLWIYLLKEASKSISGLLAQETLWFFYLVFIPHMAEGTAVSSLIKQSCIFPSAEGLVGRVGFTSTVFHFPKCWSM